ARRAVVVRVRRHQLPCRPRGTATAELRPRAPVVAGAAAVGEDRVGAAGADRNLRDALADTDAPLADIAYTLEVGRTHHPYRTAVVAADVDQARHRLGRADDRHTGSCHR